MNGTLEPFSFETGPHSSDSLTGERGRVTLCTQSAIGSCFADPVARLARLQGD